jgi:hypothetical protein
VYRLVSLLILAMLILIGCNTPPAAETPLDPRALLDQSVVNLRAVQTFRLIIERGGADYFFQTDLGEVGFERAEGQYVSPDTIGAKVKILLGNLPVEADVYAKGEQQSVRGIWTSMQWQQQVFAPGFDPSKLVSQNGSGLETAMTALVEPQLVGEETLEDGAAVYHIRATAQGEDVAALVVNLIQMTGTVNVDIYLSKDSGLPLRFSLVQPDTVTDAQPDPTTWTIDLYDFNATVEVEPPDTAADATAEATEQS